LNFQCQSKKEELQDRKLEIIDFVNEAKNLRSELVARDQQIFKLKEKLHEQSMEVSEIQ
jgi:hypothetical protein